MDNHVIHQNRIRQVFFLILIALLGLLLFLELYTFLPALLGAVTLYIVMRKWMFHLTTKKKWRKSLTAALAYVSFADRHFTSNRRYLLICFLLRSHLQSSIQTSWYSAIKRSRTDLRTKIRCRNCER
jgi:hypothetical protein